MRIYVFSASAFLLNLFPWPPFFPDFVFLVLLALHFLPRQKPPFWMAFVLGVLLDVALGTPLGQTAFVYLFISYLTVLLRPYLRLLPWLSRLIYVYLAQLLAVLLSLGLTFLHGKVAISYHLWLGALLGTLLFWPLHRNMQHQDALHR